MTTIRPTGSDLEARSLAAGSVPSAVPTPSTSPGAVSSAPSRVVLDPRRVLEVLEGIALFSHTAPLGYFFPAERAAAAALMAECRAAIEAGPPAGVSLVSAGSAGTVPKTSVQVSILVAEQSIAHALRLLPPAGLIQSHLGCALLALDMAAIEAGR